MGYLTRHCPDPMLLRFCVLVLLASSPALAQPDSETRPTWGQRGTVVVVGAASGLSALFVVESVVHGTDPVKRWEQAALALSYPVFATVGTLAAGEVLGLDASPLAVGARVVLLTPVALGVALGTALGTYLVLELVDPESVRHWPSRAVNAGAYVGLALGSLLPPLVASGQFRVRPAALAAPTGEAAPGLRLTVGL